jgi:hypothetical protein
MATMEIRQEPPHHQELTMRRFSWISACLPLCADPTTGEEDRGTAREQYRARGERAEARVAAGRREVLVIVR